MRCTTTSLTRWASRAAVLGLVPVVLLIAACSRDEATPPVTDRPVRVMPMGDSLTAVDSSAMGYKGHLLDALLAAGHRIDYVGSQTASGPVALKDRQHEGHPGWQNDQFRTANWGGSTAGEYVATHQPQVLIYNVGTNDIWSAVPPEVATSRLRAVLQQIYTAKPDVHVVLCKIVRMDVGKDAEWRAYNRSLDTVAEDVERRGYEISLADLSGALVEGDLHSDGVHVADHGHRRVAEALFPVVQRAVTAALD